MEIQHFNHHHPLLPGVGEEKNIVFCAVCRLWALGPLYGCSECHFFIHKSCTELPREISHPFHPPHPLTLVATASYGDDDDDPSGSYDCDACGRTFGGFTYHCSECSFDLDLFCASLMPNTNYDRAEESLISTHRHPLTLCVQNSNFDIPFNHSCNGCLQPLKHSVCVCLPCKLLLDKSCAELPQKIERHPLHQRHPLSLISAPVLDKECLVCLKPYFGFTYHCSKCDIYMDPRCASLESSTIPTINSELHHHPLALISFLLHSSCDFPEEPFKLLTHSSSESPEDYFELLTEKFLQLKVLRFICHRCFKTFDKPFFRCVDCQFNLHLNCIPILLETAKHRRHRHPLVLTDLPIKDRPDEDENDATIEYYCDACEKERRLFDRSYYCPEENCHFVAHVDCLASELLPVLAKNELGKERTGGILSVLRFIRTPALLLVLLILLFPLISRVAKAAQDMMFSSHLDAIVLWVFGLSFWIFP